MESFGWGVPVQGFSGACVEFFGDQGELVWRELSKVFAFGEVLTQEAVGVLVRAALPGRSGVTEVHVDIGGDSEGFMLCHF